MATTIPTMPMISRMAQASPARPRSRVLPAAEAEVSRRVQYPPPALPRTPDTG